MGTYINAYREFKLDPAFIIGFGSRSGTTARRSGPRSHPPNPASRFRNDELERLSKEAQTTMDPERRKTLLQDLNKRVYDEAAYLFLYAQMDIYGVSNKIE